METTRALATEMSARFETAATAESLLLGWLARWEGRIGDADAYLPAAIMACRVPGSAIISPDQEHWAEALAVIRVHDDVPEAFITEQRLALIDDAAGRAREREIADR